MCQIILYNILKNRLYFLLLKNTGVVQLELILKGSYVIFYELLHPVYSIVYFLHLAKDNIYKKYTVLCVLVCSSLCFG